jgi:diguanylate cyclase (GGDEF)-like protein/PAS domain S-box-containing protein
LTPPDPADAGPGSADAATLPRRIHRWLMPDYNPQATAYWWAVVLVGMALVVYSFTRLAGQPGSTWAQVGVGAAIAMLAGVFPVRIPQVRNSFAAGEIFIFLLLLLHGPAAATLAAAGESAVGAWRTSKRWTSRIGSPAMSAVAMWTTGSVLDVTIRALNERGLTNAGLQIVVAMLFGVTYFVLNTLLVTTVPRLKRNERFHLSDLFGVFGWVGIAYAGSAAVAVLLDLTYQQSGIGVLMAMVPILGMLLATLHYFFRQQEAAETARLSKAEAQAREAELAARHVRELEASERRFHSAFTHASIGMALLHLDGHVLQANEALHELLGTDETHALKRIQDHAWPDDVTLLERQLRLAEQPDFDGFAVELRCRHRDGRPVWVAAHGSFFSEPGASAPCLILQVQNISARRDAEAGLQHIAFHDSLTGLPNRRRFHELLELALKAVRAGAHQPFAVMFLDFDRFKLINDSLGHAAGDDFLVQVAQRIREVLRPQDIVARLGGDEFAVLVQHLDDDRAAIALAERLMAALARPFAVAGTEINTSASIGITFSTLGYTRSDEMLRDADTAMYKAKGAGKARYEIFDASLHTEVARRLRLEGDLRRAIEGGQLSIVYQPLYHLGTGRLTGFEALARWNHPDDGPVSPQLFIPIAEETGLMLRLTDFVLTRACQQLGEWQRIDPALAELAINVNVSGNDLAHSGFVGRVTRALVDAGVKAHHLTLELTENILMSRIEGALPLLQELREMGVRLAVDDFGTGYSSLAHLATLPIDGLKVDRTFVHQLRTGSKEAAVVRSIVLLGSSLGKEVIAEGIETDSQFGQLVAMGCERGQGHLMSRPLDAAAARLLLERSLERTLALNHPTTHGNFGTDTAAAALH